MTHPDRPPEPPLITIKEVAANCGIRKGYAFKIINRLKIHKHKRKSSDRHGQRVAHISKEDVERVKSEVHAVKAIRKSPSQDGLSPTLPESGVFYLIQLEPELEPGRFKVGFSSNMAERLRAHRCIAPYVKTLKTWPCKSLWEKTAIHCVTKGCKQLHTEVFSTDSIDTVIEEGDKFFGLLPVE